MNRFVSFLGALSVACAAPLAVAAAAEAAPLSTVTVERVMAEKLPSVSDVQWLGNGQLIGNLSLDGHSVQTVWPLEGGHSHVLAPGEGGRLSPDGKRFIAREGEDWVVREMQGARRELARVPGAYGENGSGRMAWSRDSEQIALVQDVATLAVPPAKVLTENGARIEDVGAQADARDAGGFASTTITVLDLRAPDKPRRFPFIGRLNALDWGAADDLYFVVQPFWNTGGKTPSTAVQVLQHGEVREVFRVKGIMQAIGARISPDGRWMSVICDIDNQVWEDFTSLLVVDLSNGKTRRLTRDKYVTGDSARWARDSSGLYFSARDAGWRQLYHVDLLGKVTALTDSPTVKREMQISPDERRLAYAATDGLGKLELRVMDLKTRRDQQVAVLDDPSTRYRLGRFERVKYPAPDGLNIAAWVIYPPDFDPSKKYPMYVDVHGGGPAQYLLLMAPISIGLASGPLAWHAWAARGYVVFVPDFRSAGDYGPGVASARYRSGDFNGIEADTRDIEAGTKWMLERPYIDASRVALFGLSAGGARINRLLTRGSIYRAGVMDDAIAAGVLPEFIETMSGPFAGTTASMSFWNGMVGKFSEKPQAYLGGFLFDGYKSTAPTLILVGGDRNKGALNPLSAEVLFSMLRRNGVPTRMLRYVDEGHGFSTPASATHAFEQVAGWFARYMDMATDANGKILFDGGRVKGLGSNVSELRQPATSR